MNRYYESTGRDHCVTRHDKCIIQERHKFPLEIPDRDDVEGDQTQKQTAKPCVQWQLINAT